MAATDKLAMSRALGAAFLSHRVQQLERSTATHPLLTRPHTNTETPRRSSEGNQPAQVADIIVVDTSILVHSLSMLRAWCRDGRKEQLIVPLEALNTLDLLKKGLSTLPAKARMASRTLEQLVGVNPRIEVQREDAFVAWDALTFESDEEDAAHAPPPEWLRRTICCARYQASNAATSSRVVIAVAKVEESNDMASATHDGKLVREWAARSGIKVLDVAPSRDPETTQQPNGRGNGRGGRQSPSAPRRSNEHVRVKKPMVERPAAIVQPPKVIRVLARGEKLEP